MLLNNSLTNLGILGRAPSYWQIKDKTAANLDFVVGSTLIGSINANISSFSITPQNNKTLYIAGTKWSDFVKSVSDLQSLTSGNSITVTKKTSNDLSVVAEYKSGIVTIRGYAWTHSMGTQNKIILTIPSKYAPRTYGMCTAGGLTNDGTNIIGYGITSLNSNGTLFIKYSTNSGFVFFNFCYAI